jgi:hypothetical protein
MSTYTLTLLDTTGIQSYIFGSNVLRENIGASELVRRATRLWPFELIRQKKWTNVKAGQLQGDLDELDDTLQIEKHSLDAEVIYAGGGNCAILFAPHNDPKEFVTSLSRQVLSEAAGLELMVAHVKVNWEEDALAEKVKEALDLLDKQKLARRISTPLLGVGTTVACRSTGLPAVGTDADEPNLKAAKAPARTLSANILAKRRALKEANQRLEKLLPQFRGNGLTIPYELDNFGRTSGEISYIAVVHADGNGMGKRIEALRQDFQDPQKNRSYIQTMRDFSRAVEGAAKEALNELGDLLLCHRQRNEDTLIDTLKGITQQEDGTKSEIGQIEFSRDQESSHVYIPFRPLVFGGDDLTFVTDGRLGLALTAAYLNAFETAIAEQVEKKQHVEKYIRGLQACAGVAVVKAHYPFSRAYELSEELCGHAKEESKREYSALDWHFAASGLFGQVKQIRERQYNTVDGQLEIRPISLHRPLYLEQPWRSWPAFAQVVKTFLLDEAWRDKRNKVIALRQALRDGPKAVEQFRVAYQLDELPMLDSNFSALQTTGWDGAGRCGYFDAIEALDFFLPLEG